MNATERGIEFFHGYTYSGHPLAAAAGLATLELYATEGLFARAASHGARCGRRRCTRCADAPHVIDIRNLGLVGGIELEPRAGAPGARGFDAFVDAFHTEDC